MKPKQSVRAQRCSALPSLSKLTENPKSVTILSEIAEKLSGSSLKVVDLRYKIPDVFSSESDGDVYLSLWEEFCDVMSNSAGVQNLQLQGNGIGSSRNAARAFSALTKCIHKLNSLQSLNLSANQIKDSHIPSLCDSLKSTKSLKELYLYANEIGDNGAKTIADFLPSNPNLSVLELSFNAIGDSGALRLAEKLKLCMSQSQGARWLHLSRNRIGRQGVQSLTSVLPARAPTFLLPEPKSSAPKTSKTAPENGNSALVEAVSGLEGGVFLDGNLECEKSRPGADEKKTFDFGSFRSMEAAVEATSWPETSQKVPDAEPERVEQERPSKEASQKLPGTKLSPDLAPASAEATSEELSSNSNSGARSAPSPKPATGSVPRVLPAKRSQPVVLRKRQLAPTLPPSEDYIRSDPCQLSQLLPGDWHEALAPDSSALTQLAKLDAELAKLWLEGVEVYPKYREVFAALEMSPLRDTRVVIIGQDPYPTRGSAHGLAFSNPMWTPRNSGSVSRSLTNVFLEVQANLLARGTSWNFPQTGDLRPWARQGVLLLNAALTYPALGGVPDLQKSRALKAHRALWHPFTRAALKAVAQKPPHTVVFVMWGKDAQGLASTVKEIGSHKVLMCPHPSPMAKGFLGCGHFNEINDFLESTGSDPIDWRL